MSWFDNLLLGVSRFLDHGTVRTPRRTGINFVGTGCTVTDNPGLDCYDVDLGQFLPLTGGTLTGELSGTTIAVSESISAPYVSGTTVSGVTLSGTTISGTSITLTGANANANLGGGNLSNFVTAKSIVALMDGGASWAQVYSYTPTLAEYDLLTLGIRIIAWETATRTLSGAADCELTVYRGASGLVIQGTPVWDKTSKGFPSTFDCSVSASGNAISIQAKPGANAAKCLVRVWHQLPEGLTS